METEMYRYLLKKLGDGFYWRRLFRQHSPLINDAGQAAEYFGDAAYSIDGVAFIKPLVLVEDGSCLVFIHANTVANDRFIAIVGPTRSSGA